MSVVLPWRSIRLQVRNSRVEIPSEYIRAKRIVLTVALGILMILFGLLPALLAEDAGFRAFMMLFSVGVIVLLPGVIGIACVPSNGKTSVSPDGPLEFIVTRVPDIFLTASYVIWGAAGVVGLVSSMQPGSYLSDPVGRYSPWVVIPLVTFAVFDQIRRAVKPRGITLSEEGVQWQDLRRGSFVAWENLESVELGAYKGMKRLYMREYAYGSDPHIIEPSGLGSDPIVIAEVIEYFRTHPKDRETLSDPAAALSLVTEPVQESK